MFATYQRKAMGFKDLPIELYEVKKFVNNLLLFNKIETQEKADSITRISQKNEIVRKVSSEIKVYSEQDHLKRANELTKSLYNELKTSIISISPEIQIKSKKLYIAFVHNTNFSDFVIRKERLDVFINLKKGTLNDPKKMAIDVSESGHWGNGDYLLKISDVSDVGYVLTLIRQSFDAN